MPLGGRHVQHFWRRIGRSLGSFVERNFLVPEVILPKLRQADLTGKIGAWLALPQTAPMVADWIITVLKRLLAAGHSARINELIQHTVGQQLRTVDLAPLLGRAIEILTTSKESDVLFEKAVEIAESWIAANRTQLDEMVEQRRPGGFLEPSIAALRLPLWTARSNSWAAFGSATAKFACGSGPHSPV